MKVKFPLRYRIAVTIFILEAVMMALVLWYTLSLSIKENHNQQIAHEQTTLNAVSEISRNALLSDEYDELMPYIMRISHDISVASILVANNQRIVIASSDISNLGKPIPNLTDTQTMFWRVHEIRTHNEMLGILAIQFTNAQFQKSMGDIRNLGIAIAATGMLIIALVGMVMSYFLTRRLDSFTHAAQRLANGERGVQVNLPGTDEIAELGKAFDHMAAKIENNIVDLEEGRKRFALAVSGSNDGIWDWDIVSDKVYFSPRWKEILNFEESDPQFAHDINDWRSRIHPEDREETLNLLNKCLAGEFDYFTSEHRLMKKSEQYVWVLIRGKTSRDNSGKVIRMTGSLSDITKRKTQEVTIQHQASHDSMTNLPNRKILHERLEHALQQAERDDMSLAVMMIDIDRFKEINDTLGHLVGDAVLQEVALRLQTTLRQSDTIARFGGDEFTIILPRVDAQQAALVANKIAKSLSPAIIADKHNLHVEASIGIALYPEHGHDSTVLIRFSDIAMYMAKRSGSGYAFYDPVQDPNNVNHLTLTGEIKRAVENNELVLHYQPKVDLKSGSPIGVEALIRWRHPTLGLLTPDVFIPSAERCGLIKPLTAWVLNEAIRQHHAWKQAGVELKVAINLSTRSLQDVDFPSMVSESLKNLNIAPQWLEFEITESAMMADPDLAHKILTQINDLGVRISIDDFGTGYSSLAYLQRLPVQELKIDKSFVNDISHRRGSIAIVQAIVDLGHNLELKVVAEGVESQTTYNELMRLGCDMAQGYYICRPLSAASLISWLQASVKPKLTKPII